MKFLVSFLISLWASAVSEIVLDRMIIWNVGQGLWVTIVSLESCTHIDMGGEKIDWKKVAKLCGAKVSNNVVFSHWDLDHISFAERASRQLSGFCIANPPRGPATSEKQKIFSKFRACKESEAKSAKGFAKISELKFSPIGKKIKANDMSRVYLSRSALFPGDSTSKQERVWSQVLSSRKLKHLVLGHHGSRTSSSEKLLKQLPDLRLAIASARKKRYGHPHRSVSERLRKRGVSLVGTEQWNNIVIELK